MYKSLPFYLFIFCFISFFSSLYSQYPDWINYTRAETITSLCAENNFIWVGSYNGGLIKVDKATGAVDFYNKANSGLPGNTVYTVFKEYAGSKWIGTFYGVATLDGTSWTIYDSSNSDLPHNRVNTITEDDSSNIWIGTGYGLAKFDGSVWTVYTSSNSDLPSNGIKVIEFDDFGNLWIATSYGLAKFTGTDWTVYNAANSALVYNEVISMAIDVSNNVWAGTAFYDPMGNFGGGLARLDDTTWSIYNTANSDIPDDFVNAIAVDDSGNTWVGTTKGAAKFDGSAWSIYDITDGLPDNNVSAIVVDNSMHTWVGTGSGDLVKVTASDTTIFDISTSGLPDNYVNVVKLDAVGVKWIGTNGGAAEFDGAEWTVYDTLNGLPNHYVNAIAFDGSGNKWFGTRNSLAKFDGTNWTVYDTSNSELPDNYINALAVDECMTPPIPTCRGTKSALSLKAIPATCGSEHEETGWQN
jgi:ligand-binding sensor domain-containing protein